MGWIRRWWWAIVLALVLALRIALPGIVRSQIEQRASAATGATVTVGDVALALVRGGVELSDVAVREKNAPADEKPIIGWKRLAVFIRWLPLFRKTIRFASIDLVEPEVAVDRLQSGDINLLALVPKSEPAPEAAPAAEKPAPGSAWKLGIDYFGLHHAGIRFRDLVIPDTEPVQLALESIEVHDIAFTPEVYGGPADIKFVAKLDEGAVRTRARFTPRVEGQAVDVTLNVTRLPVHRSRVYVPDVAWSDLTGNLSMSLRYRLETGGRNELSGKVALEDLIAWVAGLDEPALKWKRLDVGLGKIDLAGHDARIDDVRLDGALLPVRPRGPEVLPLLAAANAGAAAAKAAAAKPADAEPSAPWRWSVAAFAVDETTVRLLSDLPPIDIGVSMDAKTLSGPRHDASPLKLGLTHGDGHIDVDGTLKLDPFGFSGSVASGSLGLSDFLDVMGIAPASVLQAGKLDSQAQVALASGAKTPGDVEVSSGTFALDGPWVAAADPSEFGAGAKRIAIALDDVTVPGAFLKEPPPDRPITVAVRSFEVTAPYARITRTDHGIVLPSFAPGPPPAAGAPAAKSPEPSKTAEPPKPPEKTPPADAPKGAAPAKTAAPAGAPQITVGSVRLTEGRVDVMDRTVKPFYWGALSPINVDVQRVHWPPPDVGAFKVHTQNVSKGTLDVSGAYGTKGKVDLSMKDWPLMGYNPYVTAFSPYSVSRGALFVTTKATIDGPRYDTTTDVTLSDFDIASRTGKNVVLESLGIPLTVALALLRDMKGNIDVTIPVVVDEKGTQVAIGTIVTNALLKAIVGALTSPLKLVGALLPGGGGAATLAPAPIGFHAGSSTIDKAGQGQVQQLAAFVASRPGLGVTLSAPPTAADVRALREQALATQLGPKKGVIGTLRNIGARGRIVDALDARARGEEGKLDDDDAKTLDEWMKDVPPPSADALRQLGEARLGAVEKALHDQYGLAPEQVSRADVTTEPVEGDPGVRPELGVARR
jgi:hypothetical protein